jgi:hypothetical protein
MQESSAAAARPSVISFAPAPFPFIAQVSISSHEWFERPYYRIRLNRANQTGAGVFGSVSAEYVLDFNFADVPSEYHELILRLVFADIIDLCMRNTVVELGHDFCRVVITSDSLSSAANFRRLELANRAEIFETLAREINKLLQSHERLLLASDLKIYFQSYRGAQVGS